MLIEEKPEEFASPEQNHENGSKKKKKKKKKKNNETLPQSNEHPQPQVSSAPLVVTPISEFKSIQEESNEPKPSLDATVSTELENKKEVEKTEVCAEFGETGSGKIKKRKSKSEKGKIGDVVVVENALNHDKEQVNSIIDRSKRQKCVQDGAQSNEHNVEYAETAVQISVVDREVSPVDSIIGLNNQLNSENEHNVGPAETVVQMSVIDSEVSRVNFEPLVVTPISEFKSNEEAYAEFAKTQTGEIKKKKKKKKSVINGEESNEHNVGPAETAVQISVVDREVSPVDSIIGLNNQFNSENEHNVGPAETVVQMSVIDSEVSRVNSKPSVVTPISEFKSNEEAYAEFAKTQIGEIKKKKRKKKKSLINGEESNEHNVGPAETTVNISVVDREVSPVDSTIRLTNQLNSENEHNVGPAETVVQMSVIDSEVSRVNSKPSVVTPISEFKSNEEEYAEFAKTQTGEIKKKKRKKKKSLINGEESSEPKPSLDAAVSTEFENKKEVEKSEVYAEFAKTQTGEIKKKKRKKKSVINGEESNESKPSLDATVSIEFENKKEVEKSEVYAEFPKTQTGEKRKRKSESETGKMGEVVLVENVLNHDSEQVNEIDRRKRQKSVHDGAQSNEHNVEPAETVVQISVVDREVSPVDPTIRLNNQPANLVEQKDERKISQEKELLKMHRKELRKIRQEKHLELRKMSKIAKEKRKIKRLELVKMQMKAKEELKSTGEEKINSGICWACREPNHSIKQCRKLKSLSKDEEICFFCGEIGHSLGKCSVYIAGGGRLARCLFCNLHGHFSYNCPGHGYFQGAVAGGS
ncbi:hypothetical protein P8452_10258 [Trifolium repens]|nr:hypothetical protein P8452_10258 [Trifolium repens]